VERKNRNRAFSKVQNLSQSYITKKKKKSPPNPLRQREYGHQIGVKDALVGFVSGDWVPAPVCNAGRMACSVSFLLRGDQVCRTSLKVLVVASEKRMLSVMVPMLGNLIGEGFDEVFQMNTPSTVFDEERLTSWDDMEEAEEVLDYEDLISGTGGVQLQDRLASFNKADQFVSTMFTTAGAKTFHQRPSELDDGERWCAHLARADALWPCDLTEDAYPMEQINSTRATIDAVCLYRQMGFVGQAQASGGFAHMSTTASAGAGTPFKKYAEIAAPMPRAASTSTPAPGKSAKSKVPASRKHWTPDEEERFLKALARFGPKEIENDPTTGRVSVRLGPGVAEMISIVVVSRSVAQVRSHVQKHYIRKEREASRRNPL